MLDRIAGRELYREPECVSKKEAKKKDELISIKDPTCASFTGWLQIGHKLFADLNYQGDKRCGEKKTKWSN